MSLQAIFDPMVRAYFKKKYGGGGGGQPDTGALAFRYASGAHAPEIPYETCTVDGVTFAKICEYFDASECSGCFAFDLFTLELKVYDFAYFEGTAYIGAGEETVAIIANEAFAEEVGLPSTGLWFVEMPGNKAYVFVIA